jgi:radical SAM superfamily enzyme YgiQ (UPF0313 family)
LNPSEANSQLHQLSKEYNPILIHLSDNAISPAMLEKCSRNPLPCPWYGYVRFEKLLEDLDFCHSLKKSGCVMLKLGLESGNQGVLDYMNKGIQLSGTSRILENLDKAGIRTFVYLLFGTPAEGYVQARDTLEFVARHAQYIDFLNLAIFNLPVQSKEAGKWQTNDFYDGDLTLYTNFIHPKGWNRKRIRNFITKEFSRHPEISAILRNTPLLFGENHAPLFAINIKPAGGLIKTR